MSNDGNFGELLSNDDSINQTFINEGILGLLINEINRIEYKNIYLLNLIFLLAQILLVVLKDK